MRQRPFVCVLPFTMLWALILLSSGAGQTASAPAPTPSVSANTTQTTNSSSQAGWPSPVADRALYSLMLFDNLEYRRNELNLGAAGLAWW